MVQSVPKLPFCEHSELCKHKGIDGIHSPLYNASHEKEMRRLQEGVRRSDHLAALLLGGLSNELPYRTAPKGEGGMNFEMRDRCPLCEKPLGNAVLFGLQLGPNLLMVAHLACQARVQRLEREKAIA